MKFALMAILATLIIAPVLTATEAQAKRAKYVCTAPDPLQPAHRVCVATTARP